MQRFDVHAHFTGFTEPDELQDYAAHLHREGFPSLGIGAGWSPEAAIGFMDQRGIDLQLLSWPLPCAAPRARLVNDRAAAAVAAHPTRFGMLATLPMAEPEEAVREVHRALDELGADGFLLLSNTDDAYFGDERFEPVLAELERVGASVLVHPTLPAPYEQLGLGRPAPLIEYPIDTARTIVDAVFAGLLLRHPDLRLVLSHAGGVLPALAQRVASLGPKPWVVNPRAITPEQVREQLGRLYLDTAIAGGRDVLDPATAMTGPGHLVFGTDFPPAGPDVADATIAQLLAELPQTDRDAMVTTFAELFPAAAGRAQGA
ncbi:MAG TPA: amidohydrolase family protein [Cellulomonas sp.]